MEQEKDTMQENFTPQDTENDFKRFQNGELRWHQIRGFNDEHKMWIIHNKPNSSFLICDHFMSDEVLREAICEGVLNYKERDFMCGNKSPEDVEAFKKRVQSLNITEAEWLKAISKTEINDKWFGSNFLHVAADMSDLTYDIAEAIFYKFPTYIVFSEKIRDMLLSSDKKYEISDYVVHKIIEDDLHIGLEGYLTLNEDTWNYLDSIYDKIPYHIQEEIFERPDCPSSLRIKEIKSTKNIHSGLEKSMKAEELVLYYDLYNTERYFSSNVKDFESCEWEEAVRQRPQLFQYIHKPNAKICEAAVEADPMNIKFVKKPSEKLKVMAIKANPKCQNFVEMTEKTSKLLGYDVQTAPSEKTEVPKKAEPYPEKYYLVSFDEDLCDEGNLHYHEIVEGKDMIEYMKQTFRVNFGNMDDDRYRRVSDCACVTPVTEAEYNVLRKLNLLSSESGYFNFDDEYYEDDEDED